MSSGSSPSVSIPPTSDSARSPASSATLGSLSSPPESRNTGRSLTDIHYHPLAELSRESSLSSIGSSDVFSGGPHSMAPTVPVANAHQHRDQHDTAVFSQSAPHGSWPETPTPHGCSAILPEALPPTVAGPGASSSPLTADSHGSSDSVAPGVPRRRIPHPYAQLYERWAREAQSGAGRRKPWTHALESDLFSAYELETLRPVTRRPTYVASLEAHIDSLHAQLIGLGLFPVPYAQLGPFKGLHAAAARSMIAGLQHDGEELHAKLGEVERANLSLRNTLDINSRAPTSPEYSVLQDHHGATLLPPVSSNGIPRPSAYHDTQGD